MIIHYLALIPLCCVICYASGKLFPNNDGLGQLVGTFGGGVIIVLAFWGLQGIL